MVITFVNNATYYSYIGIGGTNDGGYYANNMFLQANNALVFNTNSYAGGNIPRMIILANGNVGIGTTNPACKLQVYNDISVCGQYPYAIPSGYMSAGSIAIGSTSIRYGGGTNWSANTVALLLECNTNTEIAVHNSATRVASSMYYQGGTTNSVTIGRDMGWGTILSTTINGTLYLPNPLAGAGSGSGLNTPQTSSLGGTGVLALILWE